LREFYDDEPFKTFTKNALSTICRIPAPLRGILVENNSKLAFISFLLIVISNIKTSSCFSAFKKLYVLTF